MALIAISKGYPYPTLTKRSSLISTKTLTPYPKPSPLCDLKSDECSTWWSRSIECGSSSSSMQDHLPVMTTLPIWCYAYMIPPPWQHPSNFVRPEMCYVTEDKERNMSDPEFPVCFVEANVRLHYWPVTTVHGDVCGRSGQTITNTIPQSAIIDGVTVTSPDVAVEVLSTSAVSEHRVPPRYIYTR